MSNLNLAGACFAFTVSPTLRELLIVLNWWLSLSTSRKAEEFKLLRNTYKRPTKSNERMPPPSKVILATDRQEVLDEHARNSASARRLGLGKRKHRTRKDDLDGARQVMAKPIRALVAKVQKACQDLMDETVELPPGVNFQCSLILKRNVATPRKVSVTPEHELMLESDKTIVVVRNESALGYILGEDTARRLVDDDHVVKWYHDDHLDETYSQNLAKKRARERVKNSEETSRDTAHTSATIHFDDFLNSW